MPCLGVMLEQPEGLLDGVDERPLELEQLKTSATREDDAGHRSARRPAHGQFAAEILERDSLVP